MTSGLYDQQYEAWERRREAARAAAARRDIGPLILLLSGITQNRDEAAMAARRICLDVEMARLDIEEDPGLLVEWLTAISPQHRKALAAVTTDSVALWYWLITEREATRVSKKLPAERQLRETGEFAKLLGGVFAFFGIDAKQAGQVKLWQQRRAEERRAGRRGPTDSAAEAKDLLRETNEWWDDRLKRDREA